MSIQNRRTPLWLFQLCQRLVGSRFKLDAFADDENHLCRWYGTEERSGLNFSWIQATFANPPFAIMAEAVHKAEFELLTRGVHSVVIGPAGCSQRWFHVHVQHRATVYVPDQRLVFLSPDGDLTPGAKQDSMIYVFNRSRGQGFVVKPIQTRGLVEVSR